MSDEKKLTEREASIRLRMLAGLSREQAEQVEANQAAHDAELAKAAKAEKAEKSGTDAKASEGDGKSADPKAKK